MRRSREIKFNEIFQAFLFSIECHFKCNVLIFPITNFISNINLKKEKKLSPVLIIRKIHP